MPNHSSNLLRLNYDKIMRCWEERASDEVLAALELGSLALRDSLPELLMQIADALSKTIDRTAVRVRWDRHESLRVGRKHGRERAANYNYTMDQMIFEYHILRQVICDVLEEDSPLSPVEREVIVCAIEQAVNDAATQFSETLRGIQEKVAAALTHDLRGPIRLAKVSAEMLLAAPDNLKQNIAAANRIRESMVRLDSMIHELLDASMMRAGQAQALTWEECDLTLIMNQVAEEFNISYGERFKVISEGSAVGFWNKNEIRRVLENLSTNAEKYGTPNTAITSKITQTKDKVIFSIHNFGKPILEKDQTRLFNHYQRSLIANDQGGWGLGLGVVKDIVGAHHGTVRIESTESKGTSFIIELPKDAREG